MEITEEVPISWNEAKKILDKRSKEKELGYEQKNALDHLRKFSKITQKIESQIIEDLKKIEKLKEKHIVNILSILPHTEDEVRLLFTGEVINLSEDERKKIASIIKKYS